MQESNDRLYFMHLPYQSSSFGCKLENGRFWANKRQGRSFNPYDPLLLVYLFETHR